MAEREGFEPPVAFRLRLISSQVHSTGLCQLSAPVQRENSLPSQAVHNKPTLYIGNQSPVCAANSSPVKSYRIRTRIVHAHLWSWLLHNAAFTGCVRQS